MAFLWLSGAGDSSWSPRHPPKRRRESSDFSGKASDPGAFSRIRRRSIPFFGARSATPTLKRSAPTHRSSSTQRPAHIASCSSAGLISATLKRKLSNSRKMLPALPKTSTSIFRFFTTCWKPNLSVPKGNGSVKRNSPAESFFSRASQDSDRPAQRPFRQQARSVRSSRP